MSTTDLKPLRKQKYRESRSQPTPTGAERLKTVVRRLPPNLPEEIFWQSVQAWVTEDTVTWKSYHPGKLRTKRANKEGIPSRAYIAFKNEALVTHFGRAYDGHLFRDKAGNESHAVVEYAPFQKIPTEKKKVDARNNTIDKDEDYLSFIETLKGTTKTESVSLEALIAASQPPPHPTTTPLLEALKAEKSAQKDKEAILRNHAHYKDMTASGSSKKEEAKKKSAVQQPASTKPEPSPPSKKVKKAAAAAQKAGLTQAQAQVQEGQGAAMAKGAATGASAGVATSSAKPSIPSPTRHRPPKEPHGRSHPAKGETASASAPASAPVPVPTSGPQSGPSLALPAAVTTDNVSPVSAQGQGPGQGQGQRKNRPTVGLGRQFEAALNGAGVGVSPGDRKRRDKGIGSGAGPGPGPGPGPGTEGTGGSKPGKHKHHHHHREHPSNEVVPSILQRLTEVGQGSTEVVSVQRPQSTEGVGDSGTGAGASPGLDGRGRGGARRGRGRGRGHRGG
ncbi:Smg-4/UPF3 family-domain-containing protein [Boletus reticuloceps]|uniref:Smg-4/UPF3 family-domain-containing protein n=1 Tax=Boletus reticuloceps TaxID=495285 RepID=A0A8I3AFC1_9AGAM|nr:Smg-4/UPF3 family-domain-containing protein [Boletus reticuloceps]